MASLPPRKPWIAAALSLVAPGLGHLYAGHAGGAMVLAALQLVVGPALWLLFAATLFPTALFLVLSLILGLATWVGGAIWAWRVARAAKGGERSPFQAALPYFLFFGLSFFGSQLGGVAVRENLIDTVAVEGEAMEPALLPGDRVFVRKLGDSATPERGKISVFWQESDPHKLIARRVVEAVGSDQYLVAGDKDGVSTGPIPVKQHLGTVVSVSFSMGPSGMRWDRLGLAVR